MRLILPILVLVVSVLQGCERQPEISPGEGGSPSKQTTEVPEEAINIRYEVSAEGEIREMLEACVRKELETLDSVAITENDPDWELRIIAKDSNDFQIYCESLITLSVVFLQKSGESDLFHVQGHQVTTIQSETLVATCTEIMKDFKNRLTERGGGEVVMNVEGRLLFRCGNPVSCAQWV